MQISCCTKACRNPVEYVCFCTNQPNYLCSDHLYKHYSGNHRIKNPCKLINDSNRGKVIYNFKRLKEYEVASKSSILAAINQLNKEFSLIIQGINSRIQVIDSLIQDLMTKKSIILDLPEIYLENQFLTDEDFKYFVGSFQITYEFKPILGRFHSLLDNINQTLKNDEILYYVQEYSKEFVKLNLSSFELNTVYLDIHESDLIQSTFFKVDECTLLINGGLERVGTYSNYDYFVNLISYKVKRIKTCHFRSNALVEKAFDKVYSFGGLHCDRHLRKSAYLDLILLVWVPISLLPDELFNTCPLAVGEQILISGFPNNYLQIYQIFDDFYLDLEIGLNIDLSNILIEHQNSIFLVSDEIYKCEKKNLQTWIKVGRRSIISNNFVTKAIVRENVAYFADSDGVVFSFDLINYKLQALTQIGNLTGAIN